MAKKAYVGTEDNFITFSGVEWIDTGVTPNQNFGFELDFVPISPAVATRAPAFVNAGGAGGNVGVDLRVAVNAFTAQATPNGELQFGTFKTDNKLTRGIRQKISAIDRLATFPDGTRMNFIPNTFTSPNTFIIGGAHMSGETVERLAEMKLYELKLYDGTALIKDFIPAYHNNQFCLYDTIAETYYYNSGSGTITGAVGEVAREIKKMYVGVNGVARKIVKGYVGDSNGVARQFFG